MGNLITTISDTALWVAVYRADESDRVDSIFNDPFARMLSGNKGEQIVSAMVEGRKNSWSFVARTFLFDQYISNILAQGIDQVLNLASGLDVRPYRMNLPKTLKWVDIDLPEMVSYMNSKMQNHIPNCEFKRIGFDLSKNREDRIKLFQEISSEGNKTLIISEGLVGYLSEEEVGMLAFDLSHIKGFDYWILDLMSPGILPLIQEEMGTMLTDANTPLLFAPESGESFFSIYGWRILESSSKLKTALSLNRLPTEFLEFSKMPEPIGPKGQFPWSGVCLFRNSYF
ncbi:MAG: class I SAM-dependent methyltransferase [Chitinophagaceae bacterium]